MTLFILLGRCRWRNKISLLTLTQSSMKTTAATTRQQSIEEMFIHEMDQIYYPGYSEELMASEPEKFTWEFNEFQGQFSC